MTGQQTTPEQTLEFFKTRNRARMERLIQLSPVRHHTFYQLLPLLFHCNSELLPGYTPGAVSGISDYQPSSVTLKTASKYFPGFSHKNQLLLNYPLLGVYLINDAGALSYPKYPTYDLWVIYRAFLTDEESNLLKQKLHQILNWANTLGIKVKARLLDDAAVSQHKVPDDDLDRFYSSGLVMAGALPLWWLVSASTAQEYTRQANEIIASETICDSLLDFGPLHQRKAETVIEQAIITCQQAISEGLPKFLDLIYQQSVLEQFNSDNLWLCDQYKNNLQHREADTFFSEPALLKFTTLTTAFPSKFTDLLRRSLYLLCGEKISVSVENPSHPWRRDSISELVNSWNWNSKDMAALDFRKRSRLRSRLEEFQLTEKYTATFIAALQLFVQTHAPAHDSMVTTLLELHRNTFNAPKDVIAQLPASLLPEESEEHLTLEFDLNDNCWTLNEVEMAQIPLDEKFNPLARNRSLLRILAWAILNGALTKYTRVKLANKYQPVSQQVLNSLVAHLINSPLAAEDKTSIAPFNWLMFANIEKTPQAAYQQQNMKLPLHLRDPLNYGYHRRNMIMVMEVLVSPNQQDWHYIHYENNNAIGEVLASLVRRHSQPDSGCYINSWSPTPNFADNIKKRLTQLGQSIAELHKAAPRSGSYLLEVSDHLLRIQWQEGVVDASIISSHYDLNTLLAQPRQVFSTTAIDEYLDPEGLYRLLLTDQGTGQLQLYIYTYKQSSNVYIVDELGVLSHQHYSHISETAIIDHYARFLNQMARMNGLKPPSMYKLEHQPARSWLREEMESPSMQYTDPSSSILMEMTTASFDGECTIHCGDKSFNGKPNNPELLKRTRGFITDQRSAQGYIPFFITDIKLPEDQHYPSSHYLIIKHKLEKLIGAHSWKAN